LKCESGVAAKSGEIGDGGSDQRTERGLGYSKKSYKPVQYVRSKRSGEHRKVIQHRIRLKRNQKYNNPGEKSRNDQGGSRTE